jgi:hypothetical protein
MKTISTAALLLLLCMATAVYARQEEGNGRDEHQQNAKPENQEAKSKQQAKQEPHAQQPGKPAPEKHTQEQAKSAEPQAKTATQQEAKPAQEQHPQPRDTHSQQQAHAVNQQQSHATNGKNGNYAHGRISDAHYASNFGSGHSFHVNRGQYDTRRFQYGGYSFGFIDPWPNGWAYSDDVYVVYDDGGYYMYDHVHPGIRIAINIL